MTITDVFKSNPMLAAMAGLLLSGMLVSALLAYFMARGGASLRPIAWFTLTFLLVVLPQIVGHLAMAVRPETAPTGTNVSAVMPAAESAQPDITRLLGLPVFTIPMENGMVTDAERVFGPSMPGGTVEESHALFANHMPGLLHANTASLPTGETITALVFKTDALAIEGMLAYLRMYEVAVSLDRGGAEIRGTRGLGGGALQLVRSGRNMLIVTALTQDVLDARVASMRLLQVEAPSAENVAANRRPMVEPLVPALQPLRRLFEATWTKALGTVLLVLLVSVWFVKGAAWASSVPPESTSIPATASTLRERLLAVNSVDVPVHVELMSDGRIAVTWRYADARWLDLMRAHGMRRTHRMLLRIDDASHAVRVTEQWSALDWSAGVDGARLRWTTALGITFFQMDHTRVYGLQFGPDGRPTGNLSYRYRFNLQELKAPFIHAVAQAGWTWKPVLLEVPPALQWAMD